MTTLAGRGSSMYRLQYDWPTAWSPRGHNVQHRAYGDDADAPCGVVIQADGYAMWEYGWRDADQPGFLNSTTQSGVEDTVEAAMSACDAAHDPDHGTIVVGGRYGGVR